MADGELRCEKCGKAIVKKKDLLVTNRLLTRFSVFHKKCFEEVFKTGEYTGRPVNNFAANIALAVILMIAFVFFITTRDPLLLVVLILSPLYRLFIWFKFERIIKN